MKAKFKNITVILFIIILCSIGLSKNVASPVWQDQIIYFIMIDRFADGDSTNNVQTESGIEAGNLNSQYNGGDLQGIIDQLDYIADLGVTTIWITPPIANQWWDGVFDYGGYHGYWARNFKEIDEHFGTIELYKKLVEKAHERGMYVIQDIVTNHTGNFYRYQDGKYFLNDKSIPTQKPTQYPFNMNDYNDPKEREYMIYHYPTEQKEFNIYNTDFADLDDLNTSNPIVREALKDSYKFWIEEVGVDGFRIDTALYVEPDFWTDFLESKNGIYQKAQKLNKQDFLVFGEAWYTPAALEDSAEIEISKYFDYGYNSMLDFPLMTDIKRVFKEGQPTKYLSYRITKRNEIYPDPSRLVTFIDNHDMDRFLKGSSPIDVRQALTFIMTLPGIPTIYYGTEQRFTETRQAMFAHGYESGGKDHYNKNTDMYRIIQDLTQLRKNTNAFRHGIAEEVYSDDIGPGALIYKVYDNKEQYFIFFNTNWRSRYASDIDFGLEKGSVLEPVYTHNMVSRDIVIGQDSSMLFTGKAIGIFKLSDRKATLKENDIKVTITNIQEGQIFDEDFIIKGTATGARSVRLVIDRNGEEYGRYDLTMSENEEWEIPVRLVDLTPGKHNILVKALGRIPIYYNYSKSYNVELDIPSQHILYQEDPQGDDYGLFGTYTYPKDMSFYNQMDLLGANIEIIGSMLVLEFDMYNVTDIWSSSNNFDHVTFQIFFNDPNEVGVTYLPYQNAQMPDGLNWNYQIYATGWFVTMHSHEESGLNQYGRPITPAPRVRADDITNKIRFQIPLDNLNTNDLNGWDIYVTTFDFDGIESILRPIRPEGGQWAFGGGNPEDPKIMDDMLIHVQY